MGTKGVGTEKESRIRKPRPEGAVMKVDDGAISRSHREGVIVVMAARKDQVSAEADAK